MFRFVLTALTFITPPTVTNAVVDAFGWEFGVPMQNGGRLIGPEGVEGPFLNLTRFKMLERGVPREDGGFRHLSRFNNEAVVIQSTAQGVDLSARRRHNDMLALVHALQQKAAGPHVLGTVFVPEGYGTPPDTGYFAIVHAPDRAGVRVSRPAFTLTPEGRAVLTEYGNPEFGEPTASMLRSNAKLRRAVLKGLLHNWTKGCSLDFRAAPRRPAERT